MSNKILESTKYVVENSNHVKINKEKITDSKDIWREFIKKDQR